MLRTYRAVLPLPVCPRADCVLGPPKQPDGRNPGCRQVDNFSTSGQLSRGARLSTNLQKSYPPVQREDSFESTSTNTLPKKCVWIRSLPLKKASTQQDSSQRTSFVTSFQKGRVRREKHGKIFQASRMASRPPGLRSRVCHTTIYQAAGADGSRLAKVWVW